MCVYCRWHKQVLNETKDKYPPKHTHQHKSSKGNEAVAPFRYMSLVKAIYTHVRNLFTLRLAQYDRQSCPHHCFNQTYSYVKTTIQNYPSELLFVFAFEGSHSKAIILCHTTFIVTPLNFTLSVRRQTINSIISVAAHCFS